MYVCRNTPEYISTYIVHDSIIVQKISYCLILYFIYTGHELCIIMQPHCLKYYVKIVPIDKEKTIISTLRQLFSTSPLRLAIVCLSIFVLLLRAEVFIVIHLAKFQVSYMFRLKMFSIVIYISLSSMNHYDIKFVLSNNNVCERLRISYERHKRKVHNNRLFS